MYCSVMLFHWSNVISYWFSVLYLFQDNATYWSKMKSVYISPLLYGGTPSDFKPGIWYQRNRWNNSHILVVIRKYKIFLVDFVLSTPFSALILLVEWQEHVAFGVSFLPLLSSAGIRVGSVLPTPECSLLWHQWRGISAEKHHIATILKCFTFRDMTFTDLK